MVNVAWTAILWAAMLLLVPAGRIKQIWPAGLLASIWLFVVNYFSIKAGYYVFTKYVIAIGGVPLINAFLGGFAGGILLANWLNRSPLSKIVMVLGASGFMSLSEFIFVRLEAFRYGLLDPVTSFIHSVAMFSIFVWLALAILDEDPLESGNKTRFIK